MQYLKEALSIDPGDHTGWAYWKGDLYPVTGQINVSHAKSIKMQEDELAFQWQKFSELLDVYPGLRYVYIEGVEFWEGSFKSVTAAKRQNLSKLAYLVGGFANEARRRGIETRLLPAREWKGQMPNAVLKAKILRINGQDYPSDHIDNAVGLGMSRMGLFLNTKRQPSRAKKIKRRNKSWGK
ncbi:MAG: hypothetical protein WC125_06945 [Bacteroidales bacterium]